MWVRSPLWALTTKWNSDSGMGIRIRKAKRMTELEREGRLLGRPSCVLRSATRPSNLIATPDSDASREAIPHALCTLRVAVV